MGAETITHGPGEGRNFSVGPDQAWVRVESDDTSDAFAVIEYESAPGVPGPPLHVHKIVSETWYILDGEVEFRAGDNTLRAKAGTSIHVPPGTPHTFANVGKGPARWIGIFSPGRFVKLVEEIGNAFGSSGGPPDESLLAKAFANYDMEVVEH